MVHLHTVNAIAKFFLIFRASQYKKHIDFAKHLLESDSALRSIHAERKQKFALMLVFFP